MKKILIGIGTTVLGVAAVLTWWTMHPGKSSNTTSMNKIPAVVWGGGPTKIEVEQESSTPVEMRITFSDHSKLAGEQQILEAYEKAPAGIRTWSVSVPDKIGGYVEVKAEHPKTGAWLKWKVKINGTVVREEKETMEQDLKENEAFFVQVYYDDFAKAAEDAAASGLAAPGSTAGNSDDEN